MPIHFRDIQSVAARLHALPDEADHRSAVSRNYYAAFHASEAWLDTTPGMPSLGGAIGGTHTGVTNKLKNLDRQATRDQKTKGRVLAIKLAGLKARRVTADYKLNETLRPEEIRQQHADADAYLQAAASAP